MTTDESCSECQGLLSGPAWFTLGGERFQLVNMSCLDKLPGILRLWRLKWTAELLIKIAALAIEFDSEESDLFLCCYSVKRKSGPLFFVYQSFN